MSRPRGPIRWLHLLGFGGPPPEESVALEVEHHIAELTDRLTAEGLAPDEARREAERRFGDRSRYERSMRRTEERKRAVDRWVGRFDVVRQSLRSVGRMARREPGFTATVVLTLALGIGANATMYGIIDRLLLRAPEHVVEPNQVRRALVVRPSPLSGELVPQPLAYPDYEDLRAHPGIAVAGYDYPSESIVGSGETAVRARSILATASLFPLLGVRPRLGRFYTEEESAVGAPVTAVLSEEFWTSTFGADPDITSRVIEIDGRPVPILGVAPAGFTGVDLEPVDIWLPLEAARTQDGIDTCLTGRSCYWMSAVARLNDGVSPQAAEAEATRLHQNGRREEVELGRYPDTGAIRLAPLIAAAGPIPPPRRGSPGGSAASP